MPYIGKNPVGGGFHKLDSLTASATDTYALTLGSAAYYPESANQLLVSLNGVIQAPQDSFTVSGSNLVFDTALTASDSIDFVVALGDVLAVQTVTDGAITTAKLGNGAVTSAKLDTNIDIAGTLDVTGALTVDSGIYLGGTGSANYLDDYEEGSFSPMTSTEADVYHARYTKIGNLVTINCSFKMKSGQSRDNISLPFTPLNDGVGKNTASNDATNNRYSGSVSFFEVSTSVTNLMLFHQGNQGASAYFIAQTGSQQWPEAITDTEYDAVAVSFTYQTG